MTREEMNLLPLGFLGWLLCVTGAVIASLPQWFVVQVGRAATAFGIEQEDDRRNGGDRLLDHRRVVPVRPGRGQHLRLFLRSSSIHLEFSRAFGPLDQGTSEYPSRRPLPRPLPGPTQGVLE